MTRHAAIYARLSPRPDGKYEGLDVQIAAGRRYAAQHWPGVPVVEYPDEGISAANGDHRPRFEALCAAIAAGEVAHVWAVEQSRIERREIGWFEFAALLDAAGITQLDTDRDGIVRVGDVVGGIKAIINAHEVRRIKARVRDRLDANAASGTPAGATPYGLRHAMTGDGVKTYAVVDDEAEALRWAAGRVLDGWSLTATAAALRDGSWSDPARPMTGNHRSAKTGRPGTLTAASVRRMLTAPAVAGLRVHRGEIAGPGNWPAILREGTWRALRSKLAAPRVVKRADGSTYPVSEAHSGHQRTGRKYELTGGLAVCGVCGAAMIAQVRQVRQAGGIVRRASYSCNPMKPGGGSCVSIKAGELEQHVADELFDTLARTDLADRIAADEHAARREEIGAQLAVIDGQRRDLAGMWAARDLTAGEWRTARDTLAATERELNAELAAKPAPPARVAIGTARESWGSMDLGERREFLRLFVGRVTVARATPGLQRFDADRITIEWK